MSAGIFPGVPDDFDGEPAALHTDPGPLRGSERKQRDQDTSCSCARMKFRMARATMLTCQTSLLDSVILRAEQGSHGSNCYAKLPNFSPLLHGVPHKTGKAHDP